MGKKKFNRVVVSKCPWHLEGPYMSYVQHFEDADERFARGEEQVQCPVCLFWFWPEYLGEDPVKKIKSLNNK